MARQWSGAWGAGVVVAGALLAGPLAAQEVDSPMFRGSPAHTGVVETTGLPYLAGVAWELRTDGPIRGAAALADGVLYVGSGDGGVYAVDAEDGDLRWRADLGAPVGATPAVWEDRVLIADRTNTWRALDRRTGTVLWELPTGPDLPLPWGLEGWDYILASAVVVPFAEAGSGALALFGSGDGMLRAVDPATGEVRWTHRTDRPIRSTPAVVDGTVYVGGGDGIVYALALADGGVHWTYRTSGVEMDAAEYGFDRTQIQATPAVVDGVVYIGGRDASLYALDARTGEVLWRREDGSSWVVSSAAVRGDMVVGGRSSSTNLRGIEAQSGDERWVLRTGGAVFSSPVWVEDQVYVGTGAGEVLAVSAVDGTVRWRFRTRGSVYGTPVVSNGRLYVGSDDGSFYALQGGSQPVHRAVFWDDSLMSRSAFGGAERHRQALESFADAGYETLDQTSLGDFLQARIRDRERSVVVFAMDGLPAAVTDAGSGTSALRGYLESGGKAVWLGFPPGILARDSTGQVTGVDREASGELLDIDFSVWNSDEYGAHPTEAGRRWGLETWQMAYPVADAASVDVVLATDELGRAAAFVRTYGGPPGSGFVLLPPTTRSDRLTEYRRVAEYGIFREINPDEP